MTDIKNEFMAKFTNLANKELSTYIPVIYGAVLSYGFYVLAVCFNDFHKTIKEDHFDTSALFIYALQIGLFFITTLYLLIDLGGMVKVSRLFPYQLHSRFIHDVIIALTFLVMYNEIRDLSVVYFLAFAINMFMAAIWGNNLKEEARRASGSAPQNKRFERWGKAIRQTHFFGAAIFSAGMGSSIFSNLFLFKTPDFFDLKYASFFILLISFYGWYIYFLNYTVVYTGDLDREFSIPIGLPCSVIVGIINKAKEKKMRKCAKLRAQQATLEKKKVYLAAKEKELLDDVERKPDGRG